MINTMAEAKLYKVFPNEQAEALEQHFSSREDFTELKEIVYILAKRVDDLAKRVDDLAVAQKELAEAQRRTEARVEELAAAQKELAEAQRRTEERVEELAEAQRRTEERVEELAVAQKELAEAQKRTEKAVGNLAKQVGGLSDRIGFGLEDLAIKVLPAYLEKYYNLKNVKLRGRRKIEISNGKDIEVNLFGQANRNGEKIMIVGEIKTNITPKEMNRFLKRVKLLTERYKQKSIFKLFFGYTISLKAIEIADQNEIELIATYDLVSP